MGFSKVFIKLSADGDLDLNLVDAWSGERLLYFNQSDPFDMSINWCCEMGPSWSGFRHTCSTSNNPDCYAARTSTAGVVHHHENMELFYCIDHCNASTYFQYHDGSERMVVADYSKSSEYIFINVTMRALSLYVTAYESAVGKIEWSWDCWSKLCNYTRCEMMPTAYPTTSPTPLPSPVPTIPPTPNPTMIPTTETPLPSVAPSPAPTSLPSPAPSPACDSGTFLYSVRLFDSGGDGWQGATWQIYDASNTVALMGGTLASGASQRDYYCLPDSCGWLVVGGGAADSEITYELDSFSSENFQVCVCFF